MNHFDEPGIHAALEREERRFNQYLKVRTWGETAFFDPKVFATKAFAKDTPDAEKILRWVLKQGLDREGHPRSGFMGDMVRSCSDYRGLTDRQWAAVVKSYHKTLKAGDAHKGKHTVGAIGESITIPVTLISRKEISTEYGVNYLHTFNDLSKEKNVIKTFSKARQVLDLDVGQQALLQGTVKAHGEWNGCPETTVSRPKLLK